MNLQIPSPNNLANPTARCRCDSLELADDRAQDVDQLRSLVDVCANRNLLPQLSIDEAEPVTRFSSLLSSDDERLSLIRSGQGSVGLLDVGPYGSTGSRDLVGDLGVTDGRERLHKIQDAHGELEGTIPKIVRLPRLPGLGVGDLLGLGGWDF